MHDEFLEGIARNREARTGRIFRYTTGQQRFLEKCDKDAEQVAPELERLIAGMDDRCLLDSALGNEHRQLEMDERMASSYPHEDQEMAQRMMEFRRETIRLIEQCVESSPFKGQIAYVRRVSRRAKTA